MKFIGRKKELGELQLLLKKKSSSLIVIRGRLRIGKSRLIREFTKDLPHWVFSGLPSVKGITKQRQINVFVNQMSQNLNMPKLKISDWGELFWHLGNQAKKEQIVIVFDEISWMGSQDPDFLGHLKNVVAEVTKKIERLSYPRGFSVRPVLIHVNGVGQGVRESTLFSQIVDFSDFFSALENNVVDFNFELSHNPSPWTLLYFREFNSP